MCHGGQTGQVITAAGPDSELPAFPAAIIAYVLTEDGVIAFPVSAGCPPCCLSKSHLFKDIFLYCYVTVVTLSVLMWIYVFLVQQCCCRCFQYSI